jgi:uncharacterized damage-inducible protein DinB
MSEKANIIDQLKRLHGDAWYGPSIRKILQGVSPQMAVAQVHPQTHSIWELVLHIASWEEVFTLRLKGQQKVSPDAGDFPPVTDTSSGAWEKAIKYLEDANENLIRTIQEMPESRFDEIVVGKDYTIRFMLVGIIQHHVYHSGQISMLKKLQSAA